MEKNNSFTLIELVVVIGIITLIMGISLAYYNNFNEETKFRTEMRKLWDVLELAKKKAITGDEPSGCVGFSGYKVNFTNSTYQLQACCGTVCTTTASYTLPSNITIIVPALAPPLNCIKFKQLNGDLDSDPLVCPNFKYYPDPNSYDTLRLRDSNLSGTKKCDDIHIDNGALRLIYFFNDCT